MNVTIREANETDLQLVRKYTVETAWRATDFSESERKELLKNLAHGIGQ